MELALKKDSMILVLREAERIWRHRVKPEFGTWTMETSEKDNASAYTMLEFRTHKEDKTVKRLLREHNFQARSAN